jgi:hypothetical protein
MNATRRIYLASLKLTRKPLFLLIKNNMLNIIKEKNNFPKSPTISAKRSEVLYREDLKTGFGYALTGIAISLALTGAVYVIGKQLIK